jgi:exosortase F-associated protein
MLKDLGVRRAAGVGLAIAGLALVFLFQHVDIVSAVCGCHKHPYVHFAARKFTRVLLNDTFMLLLIHSWFHDRGITRIAWYVQLIDTLVLLPLYLLLKLGIEGESEISSPLLSQFHRLIVNPTLMVLIIPAVYYQRFTRTRKE